MITEVEEAWFSRMVSKATSLKGRSLRICATAGGMKYTVNKLFVIAQDWLNAKYVLFQTVDPNTCNSYSLDKSLYFPV